MANPRATISPLQEIALEITKVLTSYWLFRRFSYRQIVTEPSGLDALEHTLLIQSLFQDLVLRLCKLGDKRNDVWGFQQVIKHLEKHDKHSKISQHIKDQIWKYDELIKPIKDYQRDTYMAHNAQDKPWPPKPPTNIREIISQAVNICDLLHCEHVEYKIDSSWGGESIDLRMLLKSSISNLFEDNL